MTEATRFTKQMFQALFTYQAWANARIFAYARRLTPAQLGAESPSHGTLFGVLFHMVRTDIVWTHVLREHSAPSSAIQPQDFPTVDALEARSQEAHADLLSFLGSLDDAAIQGSIEATRRGEVSTIVVWRALMHLILHNHQHRSEAAILLTNFGQSPGDMDFIFFKG